MPNEAPHPHGDFATPDEEATRRYLGRLALEDFRRVEAMRSDHTQDKSCAFALSNQSVTIAVSGGSAKIRVLTQTGCSWEVASGIPWLTIRDGKEGAGSGTVDLHVSRNDSTAARMAAITIGGQVFLVTQAGPELMSLKLDLE